jgi:hypothetical protein
METVYFTETLVSTYETTQSLRAQNNNIVIFNIVRTSNSFHELISKKLFRQNSLHETSFVQLIYSVYDFSKIEKKKTNIS